MDESRVIAISFELEHDPGGPWWTFYPRHGIQRVIPDLG